MERIVQYVKDRMGSFDDYIPYGRVECDRRHTEMLLASIGFMVNVVWLGKCINVREFIEKALPMIEAIKNA
jgi:hypothetical protein